MYNVKNFDYKNRKIQQEINAHPRQLRVAPKMDKDLDTSPAQYDISASPDRFGNRRLYRPSRKPIKVILAKDRWKYDDSVLEKYDQEMEERAKAKERV